MELIVKYWKSMQNTEKLETLYWKVREQLGGTGEREGSWRERDYEQLHFLRMRMDWVTGVTGNLVARKLCRGDTVS